MSDHDTFPAPRRRRQQRRRTLAVTAALLPVLATFPLLAGCHDVVEEGNAATDNNYLRYPDQTPAPVAMKSGPVLPLKPGSHWLYDVQSGAVGSNGAVASSDPQAPEEQAVAGTKPFDGVEATVIQISHNGKVDRQEIYQSDAHGVSLAGAGGIGDLMTISPPIPLLHLPIKDGEAIPWSGILHYRKTEAPGTALSRISGRAVITTPAGKFGAYRVDTIINTTVQGQAIAFPTTRWIAPGVGIVQVKLLAGNLLVRKTLKSYHVQ